MPAAPLSERQQIARIAANKSWSQTADRPARTANARKAMLDKFELEVDPEGVLPPAERAKRAEYARKAHFQALARRSAQVRRQRRAGGDRNAAT